jgi:hypothetical protein
MRRLYYLDEPVDVPVPNLEQGDVVFIPLRGKRLVVSTDGRRHLFLDYPRRPRVVGSLFASDDTTDFTPPDPDRFLGPVELQGEITVVARSIGPLEPATETRTDEQFSSTDAASATRGAIVSRLQVTTENLRAIAERRAGKPIREALSEVRRAVAEVMGEIRQLPDGPERDSLFDLAGLLKWSCEEVNTNLFGGDQVSVTAIVGAIQNYEDDF